MSRIGTILLTHQAPDAVKRMVDYWRALDGDQEFLVAYGGERDLSEPWHDCDTVYITDPQLRTRDHPRERQSYLGVFQACVPWIEAKGISHIHFAEFDEIPLVKNLNLSLLRFMRQEQCDVLAHRLRRIDGTNHPHYLNHVRDQLFMDFWRSISRRDDQEVVLSMLGCGSFWKKEAFISVAQLQPPLRIYLELFLPTAAHHLGYRLRGFDADDSYMAPEQVKQVNELEKYRAIGAERIHPVKNMWTENRP